MIGHQELFTQKEIQFGDFKRLLAAYRNAMHDHEKVILVILDFRKLT